MLGFHDLRTRRSGRKNLLTCTWKFSATCVSGSHDVTVRVLREIEAEIPRARVHIHTARRDKRRMKSFIREINE